MGLKKNVIEALASSPVKWINFTFANRMVSPIGYYYVASMVDNNTIKCAVDSNLSNTATYNAATNTITASDGSYGETYFDEKALLIHECTHALLDCLYNGRDMNNNKAGGITVLQDETIAYIAQAIYIIAAKGNSPSNQAKPDYQAVESIQSKLEAVMAKRWSGCETIHLTGADVAGLTTAIKNDPLYSDWASTAVHNG
ncbi:hypothetical protein ETAA8_67360 [Anatilimnocola aggregata]|uniref:Uncharacterized protein n=1 Tax=Anatilimnocola aggregata TaxID=2528021 RepID=A0A517YMY1_9BACT|nr:hypothetical protein [Anatilimnocola aggregata]QDU31577.1 hypothetical protein ETAA8_67360 [Anatilimnocola aggregata]